MGIFTETQGADLKHSINNKIQLHKSRLCQLVCHIIVTQDFMSLELERHLLDMCYVLCKPKSFLPKEEEIRNSMDDGIFRDHALPFPGPGDKQFPVEMDSSEDLV